MNWERKALESIILLLAEQDEKRNELLDRLSELGIDLNMDGVAYTVFTAIMDGDWVVENLEGYQNGEMSKEEFLEICFEYIENKFKG